MVVIWHNLNPILIQPPYPNRGLQPQCNSSTLGHQCVNYKRNVSKWGQGMNQIIKKDWQNHNQDLGTISNPLLSTQLISSGIEKEGISKSPKIHDWVS